jgi:Flp pilus assembly protein TadD
MSLMGRYVEAVQTLDKAISLDNTRAYPYNNRGFARMNLDDFEGAERDINKSLELDSLNSYAYKNRGLLYLKTGRSHEACLEFQKARQLGYTEIYDDEVDMLIEQHCLPLLK